MAVPIHGYVNVIYPDDAAIILEHDWHDVEGRTDMSMTKVEKYASLMRQFKWTPDSVIQFLQFPGEDITWLYGGRHRTHAVLLSDTPQRFYCWVWSPPKKEGFHKWIEDEYIEVLAKYGYGHPLFGHVLSDVFASYGIRHDPVLTVLRTHLGISCDR